MSKKKSLPTDITEVALCMPVYGSQSPNFWLPFARSLASSFEYGVHFSKIISESTMATDRNRNVIVERFLESDLEWSYWHDADNLNPVDACARLLETARGGDYKVVTGLYHLKAEPYMPVAFRRADDGKYNNIAKWERGEIIEIDAAGMNAALIHRSVFEEIRANYVPLQRLSTGGIVSIHIDDIVGDVFDSQIGPEDDKVVDGLWKQRLIKPGKKDELDKKIEAPFFWLEYNRTEDFPFFEMVRRLGFDVALDTLVECGHLRDFSIDTKKHLEAMDGEKEETTVFT